jgi:hypothetical protein
MSARACWSSIETHASAQSGRPSSTPGSGTDINEVTAGTRFTLSDQAVLKAEYTRDFVIGNDIVTVQAAFGL